MMLSSYSRPIFSFNAIAQHIFDIIADPSVADHICARQLLAASLAGYDVSGYQSIRRGETFLMMALLHYTTRHKLIHTLLYDIQVDINITDDDGRSAYFYLLYGPATTYQLYYLQQLYGLGADVNLGIGHHRTPLLFTAIRPRHQLDTNRRQLIFSLLRLPDINFWVIDSHQNSFAHVLFSNMSRSSCQLRRASGFRKSNALFTTHDTVDEACCFESTIFTLLSYWLDKLVDDLFSQQQEQQDRPYCMWEQHRKQRFIASRRSHIVVPPYQNSFGLSSPQDPQHVVADCCCLHDSCINNFEDELFQLKHSYELPLHSSLLQQHSICKCHEPLLLVDDADGHDFDPHPEDPTSPLDSTTDVIVSSGGGDGGGGVMVDLLQQSSPQFLDISLQSGLLHSISNHKTFNQGGGVKRRLAGNIEPSD